MTCFFPFSSWPRAGVLCFSWPARSADRIWTSIGLALLALVPLSHAPGKAAAAASRQRVLEACFAPADLAARAGERTPRKGQRAFDQPEPRVALRPFAPVSAELRGAIRRVRLPAGKKLVALTLDLCEQPGEIAGYDGAIIDYLRREGVKATLFVGGKWMRSHEPRVHQLMSDPLFEIANHSTAHRNLRLLSGQRLTDEIEGPQRAYQSIHTNLAGKQCVKDAGESWQAVPSRMSLFRFPFGACNKASLDAVNDAGLLAIQWDVSTGDPSPSQSANAIAREILKATRPGSIIIGHANGRGFHTADALPLAIPKLKAQGYTFVTVSELLAAGTPEVVQTCYNLRPGDTDRYDNLATAFRSKLSTGLPRSAGAGSPSDGKSQRDGSRRGTAGTNATTSGWGTSVKPQP